MSKRTTDDEAAPAAKVKKESTDVKTEEQTIEEELAALEQFFVVDEEDEGNNEDEELVIKDEAKDSKASSSPEPLNQDSQDGVPQGAGGELAVVDVLPPGVDAASANEEQSLPRSHGYAGFNDAAFQKSNYCLAVADPNPASGKVMPKTLPEDVLKEERSRLEERDLMELYLAELSPSLVNQMLWRLDRTRQLKGVYRIDRSRALLIFADKKSCAQALPGIIENRTIAEMPYIVERVGRRSGPNFRQSYPYDDVSTLPEKVNSLALCIQGVLHGATDILHKINVLFPKAVTIHYPMIKGRRGRPVFVYFQNHEDALEAFWKARGLFLTKYPITVIFARLEPHPSKTPWPENETETESRHRRSDSRHSKSDRRTTDSRSSRTDRPQHHGEKPLKHHHHEMVVKRENSERARFSRNEQRSERGERRSVSQRKHEQHVVVKCETCEKYRDQRNLAEGRLESIANREKELEETIVHLRMENDAVIKEVGKRDKELWLLRQALDDSMKRVTSAETETRELQKANDEMRDRLNFDRENSKKKFEELDFELRRMEDYKRKFDELEANSAKLRDYDWLDKEYNKLRNENKSLVGENQSLFEQMNSLQKIIASSNLPYESYLDANQRAVQYLAASAQRYSEEVQQLRAERSKWLTGTRPDRRELQGSSAAALDDAARQVAELEVVVARVEAQKLDAERKLELSQSLLNAIMGHVQTFDNCCIEIADMFTKCPLSIQGGSLETLARPTAQDGGEISTKSRLLRGSLRDLLSFIRNLQGKVEAAKHRRPEDPRLDHMGGKDRGKEVKQLSDAVASKDHRIAQLELQIVMLTQQLQSRR